MDSSTRFLSLATSYPELMAGVILLLGIIVALVARSLTERGLLVLNGLLTRFGPDGGMLLSERFIRVMKAVVFWTLAAFGALIALHTFGTGRVFAWLDVPLGLLPRILVGLLIIATGYILGLVARNLLSHMPGPAGASVAVPRLIQGAILVIALMTGLQHMGLDVSFIGQLLILLVGAGIGGLALAFALGARQYVANLVAQSIVARHSPGDRIRIKDIEGVVIEVHRTGVDLSTDDGVVTVPAALFAEHPVLRRTQSGGTEHEA